VKLWSYEGAVLGVCTLAFFATMAARLVISPGVPLIGADFAVSNGALGLALTGMWFAYAASQFPSGLLADRYGERRIILVAVVGTAAASGLLAVAPTYAVFLVGAVVLGGVAGLHFSVATSLLTRTLPNTGSAIGLHTAGAPVAGLLIPTAAGAVGAWMGWRWAMVLGAAIAVPAALLFAKVVRPVPPARPHDSILRRLRPGALLSVLSRPPIALNLGLSATGAFVWQATASFLPTFLGAYHGYSDAFAGVLFSVYFGVQGLTQPMLGSLSDRIGRFPAAAIALGTGIVGYGLLVGTTGLVWVLPAIAGAGFAMGWGAALLPKFMDHLGDTERSAGFGLIRTVYMVLGAGGSVVTGVAADVLGWGPAFLGLLALQAGMLGVILYVVAVPRSVRSDAVPS
jgi:MFS family permease